MSHSYELHTSFLIFLFTKQCQKKGKDIIGSKEQSSGQFNTSSFLVEDEIGMLLCLIPKGKGKGTEDWKLFTFRREQTVVGRIDGQKARGLSNSALC